MSDLWEVLIIIIGFMAICNGYRVKKLQEKIITLENTIILENKIERLEKILMQQREKL